MQPRVTIAYNSAVTSPLRFHPTAFVCLALLSVGCGTEADPEIGSRSDLLGISGRWHAPAHILADGDTQNNVEYTGAGPWVNEATSCQGSFTEGGVFLKEYLLEYFSQIDSIGGYACRPIVGRPSETSVHATGRALDLMIRTTNSDADNDLGDPIAHWLIQNSERIGIQYIIWDRTTWAPYRTIGDKERRYGGQNAHIDHLHIELTPEAGRQETPFFSEDWSPPSLDACPAMPAEGGIIDDGQSCTQLMGPAQFWRIESGKGHGDRLAWTNAISGADYSNWAKWQIVLSEAGRYKVEIYGEPDFSLFKETHYQLKHGEERTDFVIDQSQLDGWHELGEFNFVAGGGQSLAIFDNSTNSVAGDQKLSADAVRLVRVVDGPDDPETPENPENPDSPEPTDRGGLTSGCSTGGSGAGSSWIPLFLLMIGLGRRSRKES